jgi:hypothetical protein
MQASWSVGVGNCKGTLALPRHAVGREDSRSRRGRNTNNDQRRCALSQLAFLFDEILKPTTRLGYEEWARIGHANGWLGSRTQDPNTSKTGALSMVVRAGSQRHTLLQAYNASTGGLTDEEAGNITGLSDSPRCCYWKRCSELRQAGYITPTGATRASTAGEAQQVCRITEAGLDALASIQAAA